MTRIHRTRWQKLTSVALYRCKTCRAVKAHPRWYMFYLQDEVQCPRCGTLKLNRLSSPDRIDPMRRNLYNLLRGLVEAQLYHCRYCRIQFYARSRRQPVAES
jgi:hypothetical protein